MYVKFQLAMLCYTYDHFVKSQYVLNVELEEKSTYYSIGTQTAYALRVAAATYTWSNKMSNSFRLTF